MKAPVVTRQVTTQTAVPQNVVYDDYDLPLYYYPTAFFGFIFQVIIFIVLALVVIQGIIWGIIFFFAQNQKDKCKCPKCGKITKLTKESQKCPFCGADLITKCP